VAIMLKICENHVEVTDSREKNANRNMVSDMQGQVLNRKTIATNLWFGEAYQPLAVMNGPASPKLGTRPSRIESSSSFRHGLASPDSAYSE